MAGREEYRDVYLRSAHWQSMRRTALEHAEYRCAVCYAGDSLDVHHRTYERLGDERITDLLVLCRTCHDIFHKRGRLAGSKAAKRQAGKKSSLKKKSVTKLDVYAVKRKAAAASGRDWRDERQLPRKSGTTPVTSGR